MTYIPYPRSLYRTTDNPLAEVYNDVRCDVLTVDSAEEEAAAKKEGWFNSPAEADKGNEARSPEHLQPKPEPAKPVTAAPKRRKATRRAGK